MRRGDPAATGEMRDSSVFSKGNDDRLVYQPDHSEEKFSNQRSTYHRDPIPGMCILTVELNNILLYIASLVVVGHFEYTDSEMFSSTLNYALCPLVLQDGGNIGG